MNNSEEAKRERCGAFIIKDGKILLVKRVKPDRTYWVFPGGGKEAGESDEDCLKREVYEELGLEVRNYTRCISMHDFTLGTKETYFLVSVEEGKPLVIGEEKERETVDNKYFLTFEDLSILDSDKLLPPFARAWLKEYLEKKQQSRASDN